MGEETSSEWREIMPKVTSKTEDLKFRDAVISDTILELSLDWIASNFDPEEVFDEDKLERWAKGNGFSKEE